MSGPVHGELAVATSRSRQAEQVRAFLGWVGEGRALTQTGRVRLADLRELVGLLDTGDLPDQHEAGWRISSSTELPGLTTVVEWAKESRLVRVSKGRLVPVKKNVALLDRPLELWARMLEAFPRLGEALCPPGWAESLMRRHFQEAMDALFEELHRRAGSIDIEQACGLAWETVTALYFLEDAPEQQRTLWRRLNDRDVLHALGVLEQFGALRRSEERMTLTELGSWWMCRAAGESSQGDPVLQVKISLLGVSKPPVWRRLLVPADTRLDRLHSVIQAAMGWEDYHMHAFSDGSREYGLADPELGHKDERRATLGRLLKREGERIRYNYDFGDGWEHEIVLEGVLAAEPDVRYPVCLAGKGACPPEDCGGVWGYEDLREALADSAHEQHEEMLEWLGLQTAAEFDPARFDMDRVKRALGAGDDAGGWSVPRATAVRRAA
ncbi:MAG TPA: plasmid pRiA4b ORF-3 family protein [Solirubrobacteraceae bacterium]|nr:plasmid pRiA4b ORF-3 family protein [Solirubrobacteraceae bacterium]